MLLTKILLLYIHQNYSFDCLGCWVLLIYLMLHKSWKIISYCVEWFATNIWYGRKKKLVCFIWWWKSREASSLHFSGLLGIYQDKHIRLYREKEGGIEELGAKREIYPIHPLSFSFSLFLFIFHHCPVVIARAQTKGRKRKEDLDGAWW